jgi:serine/threonine-protein kinase
MTEQTEQLKTALADRYVIERELGAGGMAVVYLANDIKHDRKVALKVLRPELAAVIGAERFLAEIKVTANLQHPHILPLHDSGEADTFLYYVMPYVEGETLRNKLDREKQLGIEEAVEISCNVAAALDYAHRHDVVHRDIKPENILLHDGQPMVADFGIALAVSHAGGTRLTETGLSVGTPHYMSPEQAMGDRELDARSDVYSLGAMLYEMLVGEPPYTGPTAQAIVAKVITEKPALVTAARPTTPPHVAASIDKSLQKLPADRFSSAAQFAEALVSPGAAPLMTVTPGVRADATAGRTRGSRSPTSIATVAIAGLAIAAAAWGWLRPVPRPVTRFAIALPEDQALDGATPNQHIALSPDGTQLVYVGGGQDEAPRLWVRARDELIARPLAGTEGAYNPFFSADGRQVGFFTEQPRSLKVVPLSGGLPLTLTDTLLGVSGASWGPDGYIYFDADPGGLQRIRATGGQREGVIALDSAEREVGVAWPQALPDGRTVIYRMRHAGDGPASFDIVAADIESGRRQTVVRAVFARYTSSGHLLHVTAEGTLLAAPFDPGKLALSGLPVTLVEGIRVAGGFGAVDLTLSETGTLLYLVGPPAGTSEVVWVERDGTVQPVDPDWSDDLAVNSLALSPDGTRLAVSARRGDEESADIWVKQLPDGPLTRLTFGESTNYRPAWTLDGRSVLFLSNREGTYAVYVKRADGTGSAELVVQADRAIGEVLPSPDGSRLVLRTAYAAAGRGDIAAFRIGADTAPAPLLGAEYMEVTPTLSPDGRWLAYVSNESGRPEVYVRPFPDVDGARWQVSTNGGWSPRWAHSGRELFFRGSSAPDLYAVEVQTSPTFVVGETRTLFQTIAELGFVRHLYAVSPDDQRFLMLYPPHGSGDVQLVRVENFLEDLKRRMQQ